MGPFVSRRERLLWLSTLVVVVGIYSTLGLARRLADEVADRELFDGLFAIGFALILTAIVTHAFGTRPGGLEISIGLGVLAMFAMVVARMGIAEERTHLFEYTIVALFMYEALLERARHGVGLRYPALAAFLAASALGVIDECIQALMPSRVFDLRDIGFNVLAAALAVGASWTLTAARHRSDRDRRSM